MIKNMFLDQNRISYFDANESLRKTILFIHGNSLGLKSFSRQLTSPDLQGFRLVAIDLPGHGDSSFDEIYNLKKFSLLLSEFVSVLDLTDYVLVGHSLGGHVALESLEFLNPAGVMVIGTPPVSIPMRADMFLPHPAMELLYKNDLSDSEIITLLHAFGTDEIDQFKKTDPAFRRLLAEGLSQSLFKDETELLRNFRGQKALVLGSQDPLVSRQYVENNIDERLFIIEGGHSVHRENAEEFNPVLLDFTNHCFSQTGPKEKMMFPVAPTL